jgi:hypothetical protein
MRNAVIEYGRAPTDNACPISRGGDTSPGIAEVPFWNAAYGDSSAAILDLTHGYGHPYFHPYN